MKNIVIILFTLFLTAGISHAQEPEIIWLDTEPTKLEMNTVYAVDHGGDYTLYRLEANSTKSPEEAKKKIVADYKEKGFNPKNFITNTETAFSHRAPIEVVRKTIGQTITGSANVLVEVSFFDGKHVTKISNFQFPGEFKGVDAKKTNRLRKTSVEKQVIPFFVSQTDKTKVIIENEKKMSGLPALANN